MSFRNIPFNNIVTFEVLAKSESLAEAAEKLHITSSAVSHQITKLEDYLNVQLFYKQGRRLALTYQGQLFLNKIENPLFSIYQSVNSIEHIDTLPLLKVHSSPTIGMNWLLPKIHEFHKQNKTIRIQLSCSYEDISFDNGKYDLDIRHGYPIWDKHEIISIKNEFIGPLVSPEYLALSGEIDLENIHNQILIYSETPLLKWPRWLNHNGLTTRDHPYDFSFDRSYMSIEAASLGVGIALESYLSSEKFIEDGRLLRLFPEMAMNVSAHHVVLPKAHLELSRVNIFLNWLKSSYPEYF